MPRLLLTFALAMIVLGQKAPFREQRPDPVRQSTPAKTAAETGGVRGTVVGPSNEPLRKAEVALRGNRGDASTWVQTTDDSGVFAFESVPAGVYTLSVQRTGYVRGEYGGARTGGRGGASPITVTAGQQASGITVKMIPQAVIAGKVTDEDGEPLHHMMVQILRERWINGRRQVVPLNADSTNDLGEYRIPELPAGRYYLVAALSRPSGNPGSRLRPDTVELAYAPMFYPGVYEMGQASAIALTPGQQMLGADFRLRKVPSFRIRGRVLDENGKPVMQAGIVALPAEGGFTGMRSMGMVRGAEGTFEIAGLVPGAYNLVVNRMTRETRARSTGQATVNVGNRDVEDVLIQMTKPFDVTGLVKLPEGTQMPSVRVTIEPLESGVPFFGGTDPKTNPDGTFSVTGVSPGKYRFAVQNLPPGSYVKSVMVQGQDITAGATISAAASGVEVHIGVNAPELTGVVLDGDKQPVSGASVVLVPETSKREQHWLFRVATTDQSGAFTARSIVPGAYTVYALKGVEDGSWHSPEFLRNVEGKGTAIKLAEAAKDSVSLTVVP